MHFLFHLKKSSLFLTQHHLILYLQIKEMENRRKVVALLELSGKSDHEVTKLLDAADKRGDLGRDAFVPQRIQDYMDKAKVCPWRH
jgi:hypothetical protein